jgi:MoaD family protein
MATVKLFGVFREAAGEKQLTLEEDTVRSIVKRLAERYETMIPLLLKSTDPLKLTNVLIIVNGLSISFLDGLETELTDEDTVCIFAPIGGG